MISCMYKQMLLEDTLLGKFQIVITMFRQLHYCICHRQKSYPISSCKTSKEKKKISCSQNLLASFQDLMPSRQRK